MILLRKGGITQSNIAFGKVEKRFVRADTLIQKEYLRIPLFIIFHKLGSLGKTL